MLTIKKGIFLFFLSLACLITGPFLGFVYFGVRFDSATGNFWKGILDLAVLTSTFIVIPIISITGLVYSVVKIIKLRKENRNS